MFKKIHLQYSFYNHWFYHKLKIINLFLGIFLFLSPIAAQFEKGISIEPTFHVGQIFKHSPKLVFDVDDYSYGFELNITNKKFGKAEWHQYLNYPTAGLDLFFYQIGDRSVFGNAFGIMPTISFNIFNYKNLDFQFQVGSGIAWLTQHYHPLSNTINNAIGSNLNNITSFKFHFGYQITPQWAIKTGFSFTHFSNGATQLPNFGINIPALSIGTKFTPNPLAPTDFIRYKKPEQPPRKFGLMFHFDIAHRELSAYNGPRYPIHIYSLSGIYKINKAHHSSIGIDYEYNTAVYQFGLHTYFFSDKKAARKGARRLGLFIGHELLFGKVSFSGHIGYYLPTNAYLLSAPFYTKLALRYYLPDLWLKDLQGYLGIYLKSHKTAAEYMAFGVGLKF